MSGTRRRSDSVSASIVKEGFLFKKGDLLTWQKRYCVLNRDSFCYFKGSNKPEQTKKATGRVFLCDVTDITYDPAGVKKPFVFSVHIKNASHNDILVFQAASKEDRDSWRSSIISAREREQTREKEDPLRRSMKKLTPGFCRATIIKDLETGGIGCFLTTDYEGRVFVDRISENGPLAETGVLGEGDEILEIRDIPIKGKSVKDVLDIISACPNHFPVTIKPQSRKDSPAWKRYEMGLATTAQGASFDGNNTDASTPPVPPKTDESFIFIHESHTVALPGPHGRVHLYEDPDYTLNKLDHNTVSTSGASCQRPPPSSSASSTYHPYEEIELLS